MTNHVNQQYPLNQSTEVVTSGVLGTGAEAAFEGINAATASVGNEAIATATDLTSSATAEVTGQVGEIADAAAEAGSAVIEGSTEVSGTIIEGIVELFGELLS